MLRSLLFVLSLLTLLGSAASASAQGGGGVRHGGNYGMTYDYACPIGGRTPRGSGAYHITTYVTTLDVSGKCSDVNVPDGTELFIVCHLQDYYTGMPWAPVYAGSVTVTGRSCSFRTMNLITTRPQGVPKVIDVEICLADGTVILRGHP